MFVNSRKRARKSKLEVREDIELEEATVLYTEALETRVKDEPMIDVGPTTLIGKNKQIQDPFNDVALPETEPTPTMEFSVKIEVEECDETETKEIPDSCDTQAKTINKEKSECNATSKGKDCATTSEVRVTKPAPSIIEVTSNDIDTEKQQENNIVSREFKEYVTNKLMMLKITERLLKLDQIAEKLLAIGVLNYAGRILDEPVKDPRDMLLYSALEDWQSWYQEHSAVRDTPLVYKCYVCGESWWYLYDFREHMVKHMAMRQFEVSLETSNDECSLICLQLDVVYNDVELPNTTCDRCGKVASSHAFVDNDPYKCLGCQLTFSTCTQLKLHEGTCTHFRKRFFVESSETYKCSICIFEFNTKTGFNEHMIRKHAVRSDMVIPWDVKKCNICTRSYILIALHVCVRKTNNYGCNYCGRSFQKKVYKEIHMANYGEKTECRICEKPLMAKCMEFNHMLQHTDRFALMYKCIQCIDGRYYPDEFSIVHHTKVVHNRPFEKKFKYLEMVILPKQCLEKSSRTMQIENVSDNNKLEIAKEDVPNSNVFVPSTKFRGTHKQLEMPIDVVVKQEPTHSVLDIDELCVTDLSSIKTETVDETNPHIKISDITSLQDFIKFKTEPIEEVVADDLIIVEDKSEIITLYSSDDSENDFQLKYTGRKRKKLMRIACACGYVDIRSRMKAHKGGCAVTQAKRAARSQSNSSKVIDNDAKSQIDTSEAGDNSNDSNDEQNDELEVVTDNSDDDWGQGVPLDNSPFKSGLKYTCHCKKVFVGTLAAFKRHKKECVVVPKLKKKPTRLPMIYTCTKCKSEFNSMLRYAKHFNRIHYFQKSMCPHCLGVFDGLGKLATHITTHVNRNYLKIRLISVDQQWTKCNKCKVCKTPVDKKDYFKHWESHLVLNPQQGDVIRDNSDSTAEEDNLVIDTEEIALPESVYSPELMQKALEWLQSPYGLDTVDEKACVFCSRRFSRKNDNKRHVIEHLLQDAYAQRVHLKELRCQICMQGFPKDDRFKQHMREHASLPVYQCNLCGKSFSDSSNFCKHRKVHGLSLMCCSVCDKKFQNRSHFARHMEMHEKTKPVICDACGKISYTQSAHKKHVRCVHERHQMRVLCFVCRASFSRLKDKWDHMWLVHKERKFIADCPICSKAFRKFADVKSHAKEVHNRNVRLSADRRMVVYA